MVHLGYTDTQSLGFKHYYADVTASLIFQQYDVGDVKYEPGSIKTLHAPIFIILSSSTSNQWKQYTLRVQLAPTTRGEPKAEFNGIFRSVVWHFWCNASSASWKHEQHDELGDGKYESEYEQHEQYGEHDGKHEHYGAEPTGAATAAAVVEVGFG